MTHRLLTLEEELALGRRIQAGDKAALSELVEHNVRLVHKLARKVYAEDPAMTYDDLVQIGMLGLMHAASKYEPERGFKFSTYATWWVRQYISRAILASGPIRRTTYPSYQHKRRASIRAHAIRQAPIARLAAPLRDRRGDESDATLIDLIASPGPSVEEQVLSAIEVERIIAALRLNERGEAALRDYLNGYSRDEVQQKYGVSHSWLHSTLKTRRERIMATLSEVPTVKTCKVDGCDKPVYKRTGMCHPHVQEKWRNDAAKKRQNANGSAPRVEKVRPLPPPEAPPPVHDPYSNFPQNRPMPHPGTPVDEPPPAAAVAPDHHCTDDCETCIYREAFALIEERYPEAAELITAMQTLKRWRRS